VRQWVIRLRQDSFRIAFRQAMELGNTMTKKPPGDGSRENDTVTEHDARGTPPAGIRMSSAETSFTFCAGTSFTVFFLAEGRESWKRGAFSEAAKPPSFPPLPGTDKAS
jgi:hypothetical protein